MPQNRDLNRNLNRNRSRKQSVRAEAARMEQRYVSLMTWLALLMLTIAPITFRFQIIDFVGPKITNTTSADTKLMTDVYTYYKMMMYYFFAAALVTIFIVKLLATASADFRLTRYDAALGALCACLLISCLLSDYRPIAINGFVFMLDGTLVHICYCAFFFFGFHVFSKSRLRDKFLIPLIIVGLVNALISLLNFLGVHMVESPIIRFAMGLPSGAVAKDASAFASTFGNINYLSGFGGVFFAIFFARLLFSAPSLRPVRESQSSSPQTVLPQLSPEPRASSSRRDRTSSRSARETPPSSTQPSPVLTVSPQTASTAHSPAQLSPEPRALSSRSARETQPLSTPQTTAQPTPPHKNLQSLVARVDKPAFVQNLTSFLMIAAAFSIIVTSLSSSGFLTFVLMVPIVVVFAALKGVTKRKIAMVAATLAVCALIFAPLASVNKTVYNETFGMFKSFMSASAANYPARTYVALSTPSAPVAQSASAPTILPLSTSSATPSIPNELALSAPSDVPTALTLSTPSAPAATQISYSTDFALPQFFPKRGLSAGTGRVYIWKETLRLIAKKPLFGYGMDTLSYAFPQDSLEKLSGIGSYSVFVTKPHNAYIGYAYGAGVPALLAFLLLNVFGAIAFLRWFFKRRSFGVALNPLIICIFLGWLAYLVQAGVNDDLIATAPIWWTLFGLGAGMLRDEAISDTLHKENP